MAPQALGSLYRRQYREQNSTGEHASQPCLYLEIQIQTENSGAANLNEELEQTKETLA